MLQNLYKRTFLAKVYTKQLARLASASISADGTGSSNTTDPTSDDYIQQHWDEFTKEFMQNRIEMTPFQKIFLATGSSIASILDPKRYSIHAL